MSTTIDNNAVANRAEEIEREHDEITSLQALAVALRDAGATNVTGAEIMTEITGKSRTAGTFGNLYTAGMRAMGREAEIATTGGGGGGGRVRVKSPADLLKAEIDRLSHAAEALGTRVETAENAVKSFIPEEYAEAEAEAATTEAKRLTAYAKALRSGKGEAYDKAIEAERKRLADRVEAARNSTGEARERIEAELASMRAALDVIEATA